MALEENDLLWCVAFQPKRSSAPCFVLFFFRFGGGEKPPVLCDTPTSQIERVGQTTTLSCLRGSQGQRPQELIQVPRSSEKNPKNGARGDLGCPQKGFQGFLLPRQRVQSHFPVNVEASSGSQRASVSAGVPPVPVWEPPISRQFQ